jgi:hypothetical protein
VGAATIAGAGTLAATGTVIAPVLFGFITAGPQPAAAPYAGAGTFGTPVR